MVRTSAKVVDYPNAGRKGDISPRLLVEAVSATEVARLVLREAKSLEDQIEDVIALVRLPAMASSAHIWSLHRPSDVELVGDAAWLPAQAASDTASGIVLALAARSPAKLPVPAPCERGNLVQEGDHVMAIRGDLRVCLEVLAMTFPQQIDGAKCGGCPRFFRRAPYKNLQKRR